MYFTPRVSGKNIPEHKGKYLIAFIYIVKFLALVCFIVKTNIKLGNHL